MMIFWSRITTPFYGIKLSFVRSSLLESGYTNINSGSDWNLQPRTPNQFNQCRFQQQTRTSQKLKSRRESHPHPTKAKGIGVGQDGLERRQTSIFNTPRSYCFEPAAFVFPRTATTWSRPLFADCLSRVHRFSALGVQIFRSSYLFMRWR